MTTYTSTRKGPAHIIRHIRKDFRVRILQIFAIDRAMRAGDTLSHFELAEEHDLRIRALSATHRAQQVSHQRFLIK